MCISFITPRRTFVSLDGRPFSISTNLINTAPLLEKIPTFSEGSSDGTEWVDKIPTLPQTPGETNAVTWNFDPDLTYELAPVSSESFPDDKCSLGEIVATLTRTSMGTLVVHLRPRYLLLNKLPLELKVAYPPKGEEKKQLYVGKQHVVAMESDSCCAMPDSEVCCKQYTLIHMFAVPYMWSAILSCVECYAVLCRVLYCVECCLLILT